MKDPFSDNLEEQSVSRELREADIQAQCVAYAKRRGWWARKFSSPANRSVPDYLFSHDWHGKFACEFKALGKRSTTAQTKEQDAMVTAGWDVLRDCDSVQMFKDYLEGLHA